MPAGGIAALLGSGGAIAPERARHRAFIGAGGTPRKWRGLTHAIKPHVISMIWIGYISFSMNCSGKMCRVKSIFTCDMTSINCRLLQTCPGGRGIMRALLRTVRVIASGLLAAGLLLVVAPRDAAAADQWMLINGQTRKCLTIAGGVSTANNLASVQYICDSHPSRRWRLIGSNGVYKIANLQTGKCLTIAGGRSTDNNVRALQYNCDEDPSRRWTLRQVASGGIYKVVNLQTGKCLTIAGGVSTANNVEALQYNCDSHPSRTWEVRRVNIID
jgi:hypothetical protein